MGNMIWFCFICLICVQAQVTGPLFRDSESEHTEEIVVLQGMTKKTENRSNRWMSIKSQNLFPAMETIDSTYARARQNAYRYLNKTDFNERMIKKMLCVGAAAQREIYKERPIEQPKIPSGMNLGGLCLLRMPYSVLFFHRMKLRDDTRFQINSLHTDIENMVLKGNISLNDLHLVGAYDRSMTDKDPSVLLYTPSFGEIEILLQGGEYNIEGRYRLIKDRLVIEVMASTIDAKNIMMKYPNSSEPPVFIEQQHMGDFISRLKTDLDKWVLDYFNDYLIRQDLKDVTSISELSKYDAKKAILLAAFTDNALIIINKRLRHIGGDAIRLPRFKTIAAQGLTMELYAGTLRGLDTMYRRSVATTILKRPNLRYVDSIIGFGNLKVSYSYEIHFPENMQGLPPLVGVIILSPKEVTARLSMGLLNKPEVLELDVDFINRLGPESITVEGAANIMISNFKHLLHHEVAAIMSNALTYGVGMIRTLPRSEPFTPGMLKKKNEQINNYVPNNVYKPDSAEVSGGKMVNIKNSLSTSEESNDEEKSKNPSSDTIMI